MSSYWPTGRLAGLKLIDHDPVPAGVTVTCIPLVPSIVAVGVTPIEAAAGVIVIVPVAVWVL
jgi:hypothetical protein